MSTRRCLLPTVCCLLFLAGCAVGDFTLSDHERFQKTVPLDPKGRFHLVNVNGSVTVETWNQSSVQIEGEKAASSSRLLDEINIEVTGGGNQVDVITRMPRHRFFFSGFGKVDYHVRLPAEAQADVKTVNGNVRVDGVAGPLRAATVNGSVRITDAESEVIAATVNGSIQATYSKLAGEGRHSYNTVNGSVTLYLPPNAGGEFEATTVNGSINTDFPLEVSGKILNRHLRGRIGEGRGRVNVRTVNGSVKLLKAPYKVVNLLESPLR